MCGKSTYASELGIPVFCADPKSLVKIKRDNVTYLPENLNWSQQSQYVASQWFNMPSPWVIEGVGVVRALRKWVDSYPNVKPADQILYFTNKHPSVIRSTGQEAMEKSIATIWGGINMYYKSITKYHSWG